MSITRGTAWSLRLLPLCCDSIRRCSVGAVSALGLRAVSRFVVVLILGLSAQAYAAGFAINELGTRALGMANAMTAVADRPSAVVFNPAGLAQQQGFSLDLSVNFVAPSFGYDTTVPGTTREIEADAKREIFTVPSLYANYRIHDRASIALGIYSPFGLAVRWDDTVAGNVPWWGRTTVRDIEIKTLYINPSVAVRVHDRVYVGAGFVVAQGAVALKRALSRSNDPAQDINLHLAGDDLGFGATAGILVRAIPERLNIGISYRSAVKMNFEGQSAFTESSSGKPLSGGLRRALPDGKVRAPITLPNTISFGVAAFPLPELTVSAEVDLTTWSDYKSLDIEFIDAPALSAGVRKDWNDAVALRIGGEYRFLSQSLPVRLGFVFDQSPAPNDTVGPELPDTDRFVLAGGVGYQWRGLRADLAYQFLLVQKERTAPTAPVVGKRGGAVHVFGVGVSYDLDV